jgi:hypothetical protein
MERMPGGGPVTSTRPQSAYRPSPPSHRQPRPNRGRFAVGAGVAAAVTGLGVAVAVGAVPSPLSAGSATPLAAASLAATPTAKSGALLQASASPLGSYAVAKMPAAAGSSSSAKPKPTPTKTATPTQHPTSAAASTSAAAPSAATSAATDSGGLTPVATAENQTPTGENQKAWSEAILTALGAPLTAANIVSIGYWMQNEAGTPPTGLVGANNPINVSQPCCGGVPIQSDGDGVTFLQSYPTAADGIEAIKEYLERSNYAEIVADLRSGEGLMITGDSELTSEISLFAGGHYDVIPDSWGQSQGQPLS